MKIDELKAIEAAATPGPWVPSSLNGWDAVRPLAHQLAVCKLVDNTPANAGFIADARNHFAALLNVADVLKRTPFPGEIDNPKDGSGRIQLTVSMNAWHDWIDARQKALAELEAIR